MLTIVIAICALISVGYQYEIEFPLLMPEVQPVTEDAYLCTAFRMPRTENRYIVEFHPNASKNQVHHILIYGCEVPGYYERDTPRVIWDCGEMSASTGMFQAQPCAGQSQILYAWAMDAPKLVLPEGVGFKVGPGTGVDFLVLQVHYAHVDMFRNGAIDKSGIVLKMLPGDTDRVDKRAGVLLLGTMGSLPPSSYEEMESACKIQEPMELYPFGYRTHTHKLGKLVSGWLVRGNNWSLIGKHDPQQPQMFYPVKNKSLVIRQGDVVAARCTMDNYQDHYVHVGATGNDEMCNFYLMYYTKGDRILEKKFCFTPGPPIYYWRYDGLISKVPPDVDKAASKP